MLTEYQKECFNERPELYKVFRKVIFSMRRNKKASLDFVIDFFNMMNESKIDIIANISNEFAIMVPYECCKKIMTEILQMEKNEIKKIFSINNGINLSKETNSFISFLTELTKYKKHLIKYDFSLLELYAKHVGVIA